MELQEKHLLLAKSLEKPILQYVDTYKKSLQVFLDTTNFSATDDSKFKPLMHTFVNFLGGWDSDRSEYSAVWGISGGALPPARHHAWGRGGVPRCHLRHAVQDRRNEQECYHHPQKRWSG